MSMLNKEDIKKLAKKIFHQGRGRRSVHIMHPERDWMMGVFAAIVLILGTTVWSGINYLQVRDLIRNGVLVETEATVVYRGTVVDEALSIRDERDAVVQSFVALPSVEEVVESEVATSSATSTEDVLEEQEVIDAEVTEGVLIENVE